MDFNLPETVGGQASAEMVTSEAVELNYGGGESGFCGKEDRERDVQADEKAISKAAERESSSGVIVSKRASTRTCSLLASEKIMKLNDEVYDWEYDRKRRRKRESDKIGSGDESEVEETNVEGQSALGIKSENVESGDTGLGGEGKNIEGQSVKRKQRRKSKVVKCEDAGLGVEAEGKDENVKVQGSKRRSGRKRKVVKSEDSGLGGSSEGEENSVQDERVQRTLRRTERKNGKREGAGLQGEEKKVDHQSTTPRQGKKSEQQVENGGDLFVTVRDDHDNQVDPIGSETHEGNVRDSCYLQLFFYSTNLAI